LNSLALVNLAERYNSSGSDSLRIAYSTAAYGALSTLAIGTFMSYFVSSVGLLIASIIMIKVSSTD
jgi:hypothetical protein